MNIHKLARTTPASRALIAARRAAGLGESAVASQLGIDRKTVRKAHDALVGVTFSITRHACLGHVA
jgi:hypothetical protein